MAIACNGSCRAGGHSIPWPSPAIAPALQAYRPSMNGTRMAWVPCVPWPSPAIAPALQAYRPSLNGTRMAWVPCVPWPSPAIAPALQAYRPSLNGTRMAWVPCVPWPSPAIAPALQAYRPSLAIKNPGACTPGLSIQTLTLLSSGDAWSPGRSWRALRAGAGGSSSTAHRVRQELPRPSRPRRSGLLSPCRHRR
jgi:hypothetical protein